MNGKYIDIRLMNRFTDVVMATMAVCFLAYLSVRAWAIPVTVDECSTVMTHVPRSVVDLFFLQTDANPNNHILNTLMIKVFSGLFGFHPFVVRIPALLGAVLYAIAGFLLSRKIGKPGWLAVFTYLMLLGQPYMLDFFSLARGYSLGLGCMLTAIWFLQRWAERKSNTDICWAVAFSGLAVYANFTQVLFFGPFMAILFLHSWKASESFSAFWAQTKYAVAILIGWIVLLVVPLKKLSGHSEIKNWNRLDTLFGSAEWSMEAAIHRNPLFGHSAAHFLAMFSVAFVMGAGYVAIKKWEINEQQARNDYRVKIVLLLVGMLLANVAQVEITHTPYLQPRLALLFWPPFALSIGIAASWFLETTKRSAWGAIVPLSIMAVVNTLVSANVSEAVEWWHDRDTYKVLAYLQNLQKEEQHPQPYTFDTSGPMQNSFIFHTQRDPRGYGQIIQLAPWHPNQAPSDKYEFYYAASKEEAQALSASYKVVLEIPRSDGRVLLRKENR